MKRSLAGAERRYECQLVDANALRVVVLYRFVRDGRTLDSYGLFWRRRAYNCYYALPMDGGQPAFVRFDVVRDVEFALTLSPPEVRYTDLLLDLWVDASGARWEDEDELAAAWAERTLRDVDRRRIEATRALLARRHRRITSEVRAALRALGAPI